MNAPVISIVVPLYNSARTIAETLATIPAATSRPYEIIISDDGSTDDSVAVVERLGNTAITHILRNPNGGPSAARNAGIAVTRGDYVMCLDADDRLTPRAIDRLQAKLQANPRAVLAYGNYVTINAAGAVFGNRAARNKLQRPEGNCLQLMLTSNFIISPGAALVRRSVLQQVGGFNAALRYSEDWELWCRMALAGEFSCAQGDAVLEYRRHEASATATATDLNQKGMAALEAVFKNLSLRQHLSEAAIQRLYGARRAHLLMLQAVREARAGRWGNGLSHYKESIKTCPRRIIPLTLHFFLQGLKVI